MLKLTFDIIQDLLAGLIEQQKMLISKLEKGRTTMKPEEKTKIMKLLKELTNSIDRTRQDIKNSLAVLGSKSKAEVGNLEAPVNLLNMLCFVDSERAS